MDKRDLLLKKWEDTTRCMEKEMQSQDELIQIQKQQIHHLKEQVVILEGQNKKLTEAGNMLSKKCGDLDTICMKQQELLEEFREIFSDISSKP